jgi:hypothetical protein
MNEPINDRARDQVDDADWWASRLVDQEIAFADVPADLRGAVQVRAEEFDRQRRALLRLGVDHRVESDVSERAVAAAMNPPTAVVVPMRRRLVPFVGVAAAAIAVVVVGVSVLRSDDRPDVVTIDANASATKTVEDMTTADDDRSESGAVAEAAPPVDGSTLAMTIDTAAPEVSDDTETTIDPASPRAPMPTEVTEIADMIELAEYLRQWQAAPPALLDGPPACEDDEGRPAIAVNVRFAGIDAQAYFSPEAGVMLRAVADCLKLASVMP